MTRLSIKRDAALKDFLQVVAAAPRATEGQRQAWAAEWRQGQAEAGRRLLESFLPLVVAEAAARRGLGTSFQDLLAAGNRALALALPGASAQDRGMEDAVRHAVVDALKAYWMKAAEKARDHGHA